MPFRIPTAAGGLSSCRRDGEGGAGGRRSPGQPLPPAAAAARRGRPRADASGEPLVFYFHPYEFATELLRLTAVGRATGRSRGTVLHNPGRRAARAAARALDGRLSFVPLRALAEAAAAQPAIAIVIAAAVRTGDQGAVMSKLEEVKHRFEWDAKGVRGDLPVRLARVALDQPACCAGDLRPLRDHDDRDQDATGKAILDIGCGSGPYSIELAKRGARRVLGLDFSEPMLEIARQPAREAGVGDALEFKRGEFLAHDFGTETFDVVDRHGRVRLPRGRAAVPRPRWRG